MSDEATETAAALFHPMSPEFRADPYPFYARTREAGAAMRTPFGSTLVTRYEEVDRILRSAQFRTPRATAIPTTPRAPGASIREEGSRSIDGCGSSSRVASRTCGFAG